MKTHNSMVRLAVLFAAGVWLTISPAASAVTIFSEDFDGLVLGPNVDETLAGAHVWTETPPAGWTVFKSGVPGAGTANDGVTEWAGWSFTDRDWWVNTAGDQRRSEFTNASGAVAVADPDEWDDLPHADSAANGWYDTYLKTPSISLVGIVPGTATLSFASSWRDEFDGNYHQTANITLSYDGGPTEQILLWESDPSSPNFKDDAPNENITLSLNNPLGVNEVQVMFGLFDAGNDWWWAIDNIEVNGVPEPSSLALGLIGLLLGCGKLRRRRSC